MTLPPVSRCGPSGEPVRCPSHRCVRQQWLPRVFTCPDCFGGGAGSSCPRPTSPDNSNSAAPPILRRRSGLAAPASPVYRAATSSLIVSTHASRWLWRSYPPPAPPHVVPDPGKGSCGVRVSPIPNPSSRCRRTCRSSSAGNEQTFDDSDDPVTGSDRPSRWSRHSRWRGRARRRCWRGRSVGCRSGRSQPSARKTHQSWRSSRRLRSRW